MKYLYLFGLLFVLFLSCRKDGNSSLIGTWELRHIEGIQVAGANPNFPSGNGNMWIFTNTHFQHITPATPMVEGTYTVGSANNPNYNNQLMKTIILNGVVDNTCYFDLTGNSLTFYYGSLPADGTIQTFTKVN